MSSGTETSGYLSRDRALKLRINERTVSYTRTTKPDLARLFPGRCHRSALRLVRTGPTIFLFKPESVVFFGPIDIDAADAHRFESTLHADGADIDVPDHRGDEQHGDDRVHDLGALHGLNVGAIEGKDQHVAADRDCAAAEDHDPVD